MNQKQNINLSENDIERYSRHIVLPQIGGIGQKRLKSARILVMGAGGLGTAALPYLVAAGVGTVGIVDDDEIALSNLQRQILFTESSVGHKKTLEAKKVLQAMNSSCHIQTYVEKCTPATTPALLENYDVVLDCSDNFSTRYMLADCAEACKKPLVSSAIAGFNGMVTVLAPYKNDNPRYRDLFPMPPSPDALQDCNSLGIFSPVAGLMGTLQAIEALKLILETGEPLIGKLLVYEGLSSIFKTFTYKRGCTT